MSIQNKPFLSIKEMVLFSVFGTLMFISKALMEALPNIHLLGMFVCLFTVVFRKKALIPIYVYVALCGVYAGFSTWWVPNLYIWTVLWGGMMLLPRKMSKPVAMAAYPIVCCLHGLFYGVLYAPVQALFFGLDFKGTVAWIIAGIPFDLIHAVGNFCLGLFIYPLSVLIKKVIK